jgi:hypothetical protein
MEHLLNTLIDGTWHSSAHAGTFCISIERSSLIRLLDETYEFFCCDVQIAINIGNEDNSTPIRSFEVHIVRASRSLCFTASARTDDIYVVVKIDNVVKSTENNVDLYALMGLYGVTYETLEKGIVTAKFKIDDI